MKVRPSYADIDSYMIAWEVNKDPEPFNIANAQIAADRYDEKKIERIVDHFLELKLHEHDRESIQGDEEFDEDYYWYKCEDVCERIRSMAVILKEIERP